MGDAAPETSGRDEIRWGAESLVPLLVFPGALSAYLLTLAPTVTGGASGGLIAAAHALGIPRPPGHPVWCLLGKAFTVAVPFGSIASRANLLSAALGAAAATVLAFAIARFLESSGRRAPGVAALAGLLFAFSRDFWASCVVAEAWSLNILLLAFALLLAVRWKDTGRTPYLYALFFFSGLSLANDPAMAPMGLVLAAYALSRRRSIVRRPIPVLNLAGLFLVGLLPILYLPLRSLADPPLDWGDPETLPGLLRHLLGPRYAAADAAADAARPWSLWRELALGGRSLLDLSTQFTPPLAPAVLLGAWRHWRLERRGFLLVAILISSALTIGLFLDAAGRDDLLVPRPSFLPVSAAAAIWLGLGLERVFDRVRAAAEFRLVARGSKAPRWALGALAGAVAFLPVAWFYRENDRSDDRSPEDYGRNLLRTLKPNAVVVLTSDRAASPLVYLTLVEGLRPDVLVVGRDGPIDDRALREVFDRSPEARVQPPRSPSQAEALAYLVESSGRPVFSTREEPLPGSRYEFVPRGLAYEALPAGERPDEAELEALWRSYSWHPGMFGKGCRDRAARAILAEVHLARGRHHLLFARREDAVAELRKAAACASGVKGVLNDIGGLLAERGCASDAIPFLLEAWRLEPGDVQLRRNLAEAFLRSESYAEGLPWFERQLEETPWDPTMLRAAARGARAAGRKFDAWRYYLRLLASGAEDPEPYREAAAFFREAGGSPELIARSEDRARAAEEASARKRDTLIRDLEEEAGVPAPPRPSALSPRTELPPGWIPGPEAEEPVSADAAEEE